MAEANLLQTLSIETKLENMLVYGKVRCAIERPSFLSKNTILSNGFFALVDVVAYKCMGTDYFSRTSDDIDPKHIYFSKGSLVIVLDDLSLIGEHIKVYGKGNKGCTIKKQRTNDSVSGVSAFVWSKVNDSWAIMPNRVVKFGEKDAKGTVLEEYIVCIVNGIDFKYPKTMDTVMEYCGVEDYKTLDLKDITGGMEYTQDVIDISKVKLDLVHNLLGEDRCDVADIVKDEVELLTERSVESVNILKENIKNALSKEKKIENKLNCGESLTEEEKEVVLLEDIANSIISNFINNVAKNSQSVVGIRSKKRGKDYVDALLDCILMLKFTGVGEDTRWKKKDYEELDALKDSYKLDPSVLNPENVTFPNMVNIFAYSSLIIGVMTGIGCESIVSSYNSCCKYNRLTFIQWFWCLIHNPYLVGLLGSSMGVSDCDKVLISFSQGYDLGVVGFYRQQLMVLHEIKNGSDRSTMISKQKVQGMSNSFYPQRELGYLEKFGAPMPVDNIEAIELMLNKKIKADTQWFLRRPHTTKVIEMLEKMGIIDEVNGALMLSRDLKKEYTVYTKLVELGQESTEIEDTEIEEGIKTFEEKVGFSLEKLQKDGVRILKRKAGVLSGCAGSGKTTTSDCMVEIFKQTNPTKKIMFGAPTGKAARRLAEVVGGNVRTIHSMFRLGLYEEPYLVSVSDIFKDANDEGGGKIYLLDEMGMVTTNLLYSVIQRIKEEDWIYFLGDIKQLPPIGKGSPFANMMHFLPCVELGVSKRAAEGSKINYNCALINFASDNHFVELASDENFVVNDCLDVEIQMNVVNMFKELLTKYKEDDIQVVTGYQTDRYSWSTSKLNPLLQSIVRFGDRVLFEHGDIKFREKDRVIHVKKNSYNMPRFRRLTPTTFEEVPTFGMVNGEIGRVVDVFKSSDCTIYSWEEDKGGDFKANISEENLKEVLNRRSSKDAEIRDESLYHDNSTMFVVVEVYDVDLHENVYVLYHGMFHEYLQGTSQDLYLSGGDVPNLDLAYALTTHKMQGSQSKAIIIPIGSSSNPTFINRNMINTMVSRASEFVALIGSVKGRGSALTNGRRQADAGHCEDVLSFLSD